MTEAITRGLKIRWADGEAAVEVEGVECALALDIGGTKVAAALVTAAGQFAARAARRWNPRESDSAWQALVEAAETAIQAQPGSRLVGIGVGAPAVVERQAGVIVWAPNIPAWDHFPLGERLEAHFHCPVRVDFDGHMATLGEHWLGAGRGVDDLALMAVGTGIGGGIISGGRLLRGVLGLAGAVGWMRVGLPPTCRAGEPFYPGWEERSSRQGFLESLAAGPAILARANHLAGSSPRYADTPAVFAACRRGESSACQAVEEAAWALGVAAGNLVSTVGCRRVILGGGVGEEADLLLPTMRRVMAEYAQPWVGKRAEIVPAELGNAAGLAGAARLVWTVGQA
ncbi:MAG: ROK family protein [Limnochordaceae bacterium]|nr:ROK family protein [Limnochordaceae bacterium]